MIKCYLFWSYTAVNSEDLKWLFLAFHAREKKQQIIFFAISLFFCCLQLQSFMQLTQSIKLPLIYLKPSPSCVTFHHQLNFTCWSSAIRHHGIRSNFKLQEALMHTHSFAHTRKNVENRYWMWENEWMGTCNWIFFSPLSVKSFLKSFLWTQVFENH